MSPDEITPPPAKESPLSLNRLRNAFAAMLGTPSGETQPKRKGGQEASEHSATATQTCEVNTRSVVEALLFVGRPDSGAFSARELASSMRGISPNEVAAAVNELNALYDADESPYRIEETAAGYRMVLRTDFARIGNKFHGRVREAKLSPAALEVLSIIAYNQGTTATEVSELRGAPSGAVLSTLVRYRLVRVERPDPAEQPQYATTDRFLKLLGLESLEALPRSEDLEKL